MTHHLKVPEHLSVSFFTTTGFFFPACLKPFLDRLFPDVGAWIVFQSPGPSMGIGFAGAVGALRWLRGSAAESVVVFLGTKCPS